MASPIIASNLKLTSNPTNGHVLTSDASGNATWQSPGTGGGDMLKSTYDPANVAEQLVGVTTVTGMLRPADYGLLAQNLALGVISGSNSLTANGLVFVMKLRTDKTIAVTNLHVFVSAAGSGLTSGQNFGALYDGSKNLLAQTSDQSTAWGTTGMKTMALSSSQSVAAGYFYVALWSNGTTRPSIRSAANNSGSINGILSAANSLWATADTSITTTAPSTLGTFTADTNARWVGVS